MVRERRLYGGGPGALRLPRSSAMRRAAAGFLAFLLVLPVGDVGFAQASGTIRGVVRKEGQPLSGVTVAFIELQSGAVVRATSREDGAFTATATRSTSALAVLPSATATRTGAWATVSPAWLSVVTAYSPAGAGAENAPSPREVARTTEPDCRSMKATVTPESGRPPRRTTPWIVPLDGAETTSPAGRASRNARRHEAARRMALDRCKRIAPAPFS